jgi:shikimate kinase
MTSDLTNRCIAVVGMNGVGKSNFGRSLASKLGMKRIDTDTEFRKSHGNEHGYIDANGWDAFRKTEEEIVLHSLLPGHVVVLGGGAIESEAVRAALKERAIVLWLQGEKKKTHAHLRAAKLPRPEFKEGLTHESVQALMERRTPLYESVADVALFPHHRYNEQVQVSIRLLRNFVAKRESAS